MYSAATSQLFFTHILTSAQPSKSHYQQAQKATKIWGMGTTSKFQAA